MSSFRSIAGTTLLSSDAFDSCERALELVFRELLTTIVQKELEERIAILKDNVDAVISKSRDFEGSLQNILQPEPSTPDTTLCSDKQNKLIIAVVDDDAANQEDDNQYEFYDFLKTISTLLKQVKVLSAGVAGDEWHEWSDVLTVWRKTIDDCKNTWSLVISQAGNILDLIPESEDNVLHRNTRFFHFQLYVCLLLCHLLCIHACLQFTVRSCSSCKVTMKALLQPLADGKLLGDSIAMIITVLAGCEEFFQFDLHKILRFSHCEVEQLLRNNQHQHTVQWLQKNYSCPKSLSGIDILKNMDLIPESILPKDLLNEEEINIIPLFTRMYQFHAVTMTRNQVHQELETPIILNDLFHQLAKESLELTITLIYNVYHQYLSRGQGKSSQNQQHKSVPTTINGFLEQLLAYCHVGLARYWDGIVNDVHSDMMFANAIFFTLYELKLAERVSNLNYSSVTLHHSSLISIASVATRLIDRHDNKSHHIGLYLLYITLREFTMPSACVDFAEWSLPKVQQTLEIVTSPFAQIICFRLLQTMLATSDQSMMLIRNSHILLSKTTDDINRDFVPYRVWAKLIPLHISLLVIPEVIIGCQLSALVDACLHSLNLWHLPSQKIVLLIVSNLLQRLNEEMEWYSDRIFTELFRLKIFYSRRLLPDISGAEKEDVGHHLLEVDNLLIHIAKKYPLVYKQWLDDATSPAALSDYMKYMQSREKERPRSKNASAKSVIEDSSSLEYVSNMIDEFNHNILFGILE